MTGAVDAESVALFRATVRDYVADRYPFESRLSRRGGGHDAAAWRDYAAMGWLSVALDEADGGLDADPAMVGALMEGVGAALLLEPIFESAVVCARLLSLIGWNAVPGLTARRIGEGEAVVALAYRETPAGSPWTDVGTSIVGPRLRGTKIAVPHGDIASHLLVTAATGSGDLAVVLVPGGAPDVTRDDYRLLDGRGASSISFDTEAFAVVAHGARAEIALNRAIDEGIVALCGEALGAIGALNDLIRRYLGERKQFGRPIGANQVLQHRMVECAIQEAEVAAVTAAARRALGSADEAGRVRVVSGAMAVTAAAARHVAAEAVQMHGGIGMTHDYPVSHFFKRLRVIELLLGERHHHLRRFADRPATDDVSRRISA